MGLGGSIILIAVGAVLRFAVEIHSRIAGTAVNWDIVGDILMVVGGVGLMISLFWIASASRRPGTIVESNDRPMVP